MMTYPDKIGKCLFEIDIPDRNKEVWVYDQVSKLAHAQLEIVLTTVFEQLGLPPQTSIKIDRLEVDLGDLPEIHFDTKLLTTLQRELTLKLHQYLQKTPDSSIDRRSYILEALTFFFQHGRLPWWVSRAEAAGSIEPFFKELLVEYPGSMQGALRSWVHLPHIHRRLGQQLSSGFLQQIMPLLDKKDASKITKWQPKSPDSSIITSKNAQKNLAAPDSNTPILDTVQDAFANQTHSAGKAPSHPDTAHHTEPTPNPTGEAKIQLHYVEGGSVPNDTTHHTEPTPNPTGEAKIQLHYVEGGSVPNDTTHHTEPTQTPTPTGEAQILLHYLERGSFPNGIDRSYQQLNSAMLQLIQENPSQLKQWLLQLFKKSNPTTRLSQQYSAAVQVALLQLFYPKYWPEINAILDLWIKALPSNLPQKITLDALYKMSLLQLLPTVSPHLDIPQFLQKIAAQMAERIGIQQQELADVLQANSSYNATQRQYIQRALQRLQPAEQTQLETELQQWSSFDTAEDVADTAIDRILYRLEHGATAWWDDPAQSLEQLLLSLATLPANTRREAFLRLSAKDVRAQWLPIVSEQSFEQVLHVFLGDYASLVALLTTALNDIAVEKGFTITTKDWRETWLSLALSGKEIDSKWLIYKSLLFVAAQKTTFEDWEKALSDYTDTALAAGDIRFYPISSVLRKEQPWEDMGGERIDLAPAPQQVSEVLEDISKIAETPLSNAIPDLDLPNSGSFPDLIRAELATIWRFLQKGVLPLHTVLVSQQDIQQSFQRLLSQYPQLVLPLFRKAMERPAAIARFLDYFPEKTWLQLGKALFNAYFETILTVRSSLLHQWQGSLASNGRQPIERSFWSYIFTAGNVEALVRAAKKINPDTVDTESDTPDDQPFAIVFAEGWLAAVSRATQLPQDILWQSLQAHPAQEIQSSLLQKIWPELVRRRQQALVQVAAKPQRQSPTNGTASPEDTLLITNAGLVILAPYLPHYFEQLGMLENRVFKDAATAERGVHLLQYLATTQSETPEQHLVFNKLLCGLPLESPVNAGIELSENEISLSQSLLEAILQRWEIMKTSTVSNLRGAFLLREGILQAQDDRWILNVENKAYDIVLEYLPWTISIIKLPWMDKRLETVWKKNN